MNFKKTALATAVGTTLAISGVATSVAQADGHSVELYGRVNTAISLQDKDYTDAVKAVGGGAGPLGDDDESSTNLYNVVSRVGIKASAPINASTTAFAKYEWSVASDDETGIGDGRVAEVGVMGDFGTVKAGQMWSTFYNVVGTHMDPSVTVGAVLYSTGTQLPYRVSNAIQYSNSFGAVNVSAEMRISDDDDPDETPNTSTEKIGASDGMAIGVSTVVMDNLLLAIALDQSDDDPGYINTSGSAEDVDRFGLAAKWTQDNWWASLSWGETDVDDQPGLGDTTIAQTQIHVGADFGDGLSGFIGYGMHDIDVDPSGVDEPTAVSWNVTKRIGSSGFRVYYEGISMSDGDDVYTYDRDWHLFGARMDF